MIQDISPKTFYNEYREAVPGSGDSLMVFKDGKLALKFDEESGRIIFPEAGEKTVFLFAIDDKKYFMPFPVPENENAETVNLPEEFSFYNLREIRGFKTVTRDEVFAAFTAFHLNKWYHDNRYCGRCGKPLVPDGFLNNQPDGKKPERALVCESCGNRIYPRINPAVIVGVTKGDEMIITRYRRGYANNALIAGFTEIGETLEQTVRREVMEEVGLKVKNIRYYKSQPWGMAEDLLAGFFCEADGDDKIKMDESELKYAEWVKREDIELQPSDYSLTNEMMKLFKDNQR